MASNTNSELIQKFDELKGLESTLREAGNSDAADAATVVINKYKDTVEAATDLNAIADADAFTEITGAIIAARSNAARNAADTKNDDVIDPAAAAATTATIEKFNIESPGDFKGVSHTTLVRNIATGLKLESDNDAVTEKQNIKNVEDNIKVPTVPKDKAEGVIAFKNYTDENGKNFTKIHYAPFVEVKDEKGESTFQATVNKTALDDKQIYVFGDDYALGGIEKKIATAAITRKIRQIYDPKYPQGPEYQLGELDRLRYKVGTEVRDGFSVQFGAGNRKKKGASRRKRKTARRLKLKKQNK